MLMIILDIGGIKMKNFRDSLNEEMKNPEFVKEWESLEPEYQLIRALLNGRKAANLSQTQLSNLTGISQADISRLETGESNPSLKTLKRLANALGMNLRLEFVPQK